MTPPDGSKPDLGDTIFRLAQRIARLEPGPLARLRRMDIEGPGEGDFWVLATSLGLRSDSAGLKLVQLLALLTPKGEPGPHKTLHEGKRAFGAALAEADYPERRLLRFIALPFKARGEALESMARWLAAKGHGGFNTLDVACLLFIDDVSHTRKLAKTYYDTRRKTADNKDDAA